MLRGIDYLLQLRLDARARRAQSDIHLSGPVAPISETEDLRQTIVDLKRKVSGLEKEFGKDDGADCDELKQSR